VFVAHGRNCTQFLGRGGNISSRIGVVSLSFSSPTCSLDDGRTAVIARLGLDDAGLVTLTESHTFGGTNLSVGLPVPLGRDPLPAVASIGSISSTWGRFQHNGTIDCVHKSAAPTTAASELKAPSTFSKSPSSSSSSSSSPSSFSSSTSSSTSSFPSCPSRVPTVPMFLPEPLAPNHIVCPETNIGLAWFTADDNPHGGFLCSNGTRGCTFSLVVPLPPRRDAPRDAPARVLVAGLFSTGSIIGERRMSISPPGPVKNLGCGYPFAPFLAVYELEGIAGGGDGGSGSSGSGSGGSGSGGSSGGSDRGNHSRHSGATPIPTGVWVVIGGACIVLAGIAGFVIWKRRTASTPSEPQLDTLLVD
jgi:hypothetical protein